MANEELPIIQKTYDLILQYVPRLNKMPRSFKFTLGDRMQATLYSFLEGPIRARYRRDKLAVLETRNAELDVLRQCDAQGPHYDQTRVERLRLPTLPPIENRHTNPAHGQIRCGQFNCRINSSFLPATNARRHPAGRARFLGFLPRADLILENLARRQGAAAPNKDAPWFRLYLLSAWKRRAETLPVESRTPCGR